MDLMNSKPRSRQKMIMARPWALGLTLFGGDGANNVLVDAMTDVETVILRGRATVSIVGTSGRKPGERRV